MNLTSLICAVWTHKAAWIAPGLTEEDSESSVVGICPSWNSWKVPTCHRTTRMHEDLTPRQSIRMHIFCELNFHGFHSTTKIMNITPLTKNTHHMVYSCAQTGNDKQYRCLTFLFQNCCMWFVMFHRYLDRIIRLSELEEFSALLTPHQKATTADGKGSTQRREHCS